MFAVAVYEDETRTVSKNVGPIIDENKTSRPGEVDADRMLVLACAHYGEEG